jgi:Xaa-Pro aminopeptidase
LQASGLDALVCTHNLNVLLLSGFWPVAVTALAVVTRAGALALLVPEEARELAACGWADELLTYAPAGLDALQPPGAVLEKQAAVLLARWLPPRARVGIEAAPDQVPAAYVSQQQLTPGAAAILQRALPDASAVPADALIRRLRARTTPWELERIRAACRHAQAAYEAGAPLLAPGEPERTAVLPFEHALVRAALAEDGLARSGASFFCMSGPNAAAASAAFQQSRQRLLQAGETILVHCNSHADGYWTDITRTYVLGPCSPRLRSLQEALIEARSAAFAAVRPGVPAREVDRAARTVLERAGYGAAFRHPTGHGVGFTPIDHDAPPRLHPRSPDMLEEGMVLNIEPGVYFDGECGLRDCNMVAVTAGGYELLTPFHLAGADWRLPLPLH